MLATRRSCLGTLDRHRERLQSGRAWPIHLRNTRYLTDNLLRTSFGPSLCKRSGRGDLFRRGAIHRARAPVLTSAMHSLLWRVYVLCTNRDLARSPNVDGVCPRSGQAVERALYGCGGLCGSHSPENPIQQWMPSSSGGDI